MEIDVVSEYLKETPRAIHAPHHRAHLLKGHSRDLVAVLHPSPGIEVFVGGAHGSEPCLHTIADAGQRTIVQQSGNVTPITHIDLLPGILDGGIGIGRILQFYHANRQPVHIEQHIRPAVLGHSVVDILYRELVDRTENIVFRFLKVDQGDHAGNSALRRKLYAVDHPTIDLMQRGKVALSAGKAHGIHDLPDFLRRQIRIGLAQKLLQVVNIQNLPLGAARNAASRQILPSLSFQAGKEGIFKFPFAIATVVFFQFCHIS